MFHVKYAVRDFKAPRHALKLKKQIKHIYSLPGVSKVESCFSTQSTQGAALRNADL